ncbi:MAG: prephenate dehydrogenase [Acidobacteria bacterium]|nr:prephenate dehydrogenase [Acidobacteriota bacterium]
MNDNLLGSIRQITICGVGLIGGSVGMALKKGGFPGRIVGYGPPVTLEKAQRAGAIDEGCPNLADAVRQADVVYLATPILAILELLGKLAPLLKQEALVTDAGSTKAAICERANSFFPGKPWFVGGHPMAGKESTGIENAEAGLFQGARYALTPYSRHHLDPPVVRAFMGWLDRIGARILILDAEVHDEIVTWTSHLPQLVSTALAVAVMENLKVPEDLEVSAGGLRDASRLAESAYGVWRDICLTNAENLEQALTTLTQGLEHIRDNLRSRELEHIFERANELRRQLKSPTLAE